MFLLLGILEKSQMVTLLLTPFCYDLQFPSCKGDLLDLLDLGFHWEELIFL